MIIQRYNDDNNDNGNNGVILITIRTLMIRKAITVIVKLLMISIVIMKMMTRTGRVKCYTYSHSADIFF